MCMHNHKNIPYFGMLAILKGFGNAPQITCDLRAAIIVNNYDYENKTMFGNNCNENA